MAVPAGNDDLRHQKLPSVSESHITFLFWWDWTGWLTYFTPQPNNTSCLPARRTCGLSWKIVQYQTPKRSGQFDASILKTWFLHNHWRTILNGHHLSYIVILFRSCNINQWEVKHGHMFGPVMFQARFFLFFRGGDAAIECDIGFHTQCVVATHRNGTRVVQQVPGLVLATKQLGRILFQWCFWPVWTKAAKDY